MHMEKKEDKWRKPRSVKGWIESFVGPLRSLVNSVRWSSKTQYTDVTKDQYCVIS
ncbi:hypothetical protein T01_5072 [Trichinella spiralis]|uniref:Uncharacterized protein n=1 Tax=Trichinella spiralis TaxID=6334 RepID=A0A0V0YZ31_TRISP|nr:hypothetical protein T01_5072 [Trichinella spiralis]